MRHAARLLLLVLLLGPSPYAAAALDDTGRSAAWLLERATLVHDNGMHNVLLRALRQMRDPELQPLFQHLVQHRHPGLRIHGILGMAEIDPEQQIDLALLAELDEPAIQAQLVSSALENNLLNVDNCKRLMSWPDLEPAVKIIVATRLVSEGVAVDEAVLREARRGDNAAMAGMAALLMMEQGHAEAAEDLDRLNLSDTPGRDNIRAMLLQTAVRFEFETIGPWAVKVAQEPHTNASLRLLALRTGVRFGAPDAVQLWKQRFESSISPADRIRLSVLAMDLADRLDAELFDLLIADEQEVVQQMGQVGRRIARGEAAEEQMLTLLEQNHLLASKWVLEYGKTLPIDEALPLLVGVVVAAEAEPNPARFRGQRLENAVLAAQDIAERAEDAATLVPQLIESSAALTQEAILMGLIRAGVEQPQRLIEPVETWASDTARSLALILRIKHGLEPDNRAMADLALIVRGGAGLQEPLRVQAAWLYLKLSGQKQEALADVLHG